MRRLLVTICLFLGFAAPAVSAELTATAAQFGAVLQSAKPGDTIRLRGEGWGDQFWRNVVKAAPGVVVRPDHGQDIVLNSLTLSHSEGLTVRGVRVKSAAAQAVRVLSSKRVAIESCDISGDPTTTDGAWVRFSEDVAIRGCRFHDLRRGVFHEVNRRFTVEDGDFRNIYSDAIRGGRETDGVIFRRLNITNLHLVGGDHLDAIQFWTTNAKVPTRNVLIEDVVYRRGDGDPAQGILIGNEADLPYENIVVRRVAVVGGLYNGISLSGVINGVVEDSFVQPMAGAVDARGKPVDRVWIQFRGSTGGVSRNNAATLFQPYQNVSDPSNEGFRRIKGAKKGDYSDLEAWLAEPRATSPQGD